VLNVSTNGKSSQLDLKAGQEIAHMYIRVTNTKHEAAVLAVQLRGRVQIVLFSSVL
jgi:hypothetical protein